ncbi:MAG: glycosyl hydrolase, partial [Kiritimatiellae bacterium]|nr:glycosyl hydrolase [Kiritimatiellia bacterium]
RMKSGWYVTRRTEALKAVGSWSADAALPKGGYAISVNQEGITVRFADEDGRCWAKQTLRQLAKKTTDGLRFPCVRIRDWPRTGTLNVNCAPLKVDRLTPETRAVFENLKTLPNSGRLLYSWTFPWDWHQNERDCPLEAANGDLQQAGQVEQAVGLSPLLYFEDFYKVVGTYRGEEFYKRHRKLLSEAIRQAYRQWHSIPVMGWHPENPYVPSNMCRRVHGDSSFYAWRYKSPGYPQEHRYVFKEILEGTGGVCGLGRDTRARALDAEVKPYANPRAWFLARIQEMADFLKTLVDDNGRPIPVIVRLFHECEDDWAWWQDGSVAREDYVKLFRLTVTALRRLTGGGRNLLFLYSPDKNWQTLGDTKSKDDFMYRYPGDDVVDIIGYDDYSIGEGGPEWDEKYGERGPLVRSEQFFETVRKMRLVTEEAAKRGKACGLVETGVRNKADDACERWILKTITAPGVGFAFVNFWCYSTIPSRPAAVEDWKRFVHCPELLTVRDGLDLTKWDGRHVPRKRWHKDTRFTLAVRADLRGVKPKYWDLRKLMDIMAATGFKRLELTLDAADVFKEEMMKDLAKNCTHYRKMGLGVLPDPYGLTTPAPAATAVRYVDYSGETDGLADRLRDELLRVSEEHNGFRADLEGIKK